MSDNRSVQVVAFVVLCFIWGSSWLGIKFSLQGFPPFLGAGMRFGVAITLLALFVLRRKGSLRLPRQFWWPVFLSGVLTYVFDYGLIYWSSQYLSAGVTAVLFATFPLWTSAMAIFVFRLESFRGGVLTGMLLGFGGVAVIFSQDLQTANLEGLSLLAGLGVVAGAAGGAYAVGLTKSRLGALDPALLTFHQMIPGMVGLAAIGILSGESVEGPVPGVAWGAVVYLGAIASALAFSLYYWLLKSFHASSMSLIIYVTPVLALLLDWAVVGARPSPAVALGVLLIFSGIFLAEYPKYRRLRQARRLEASS